MLRRIEAIDVLLFQGNRGVRGFDGANGPTGSPVCDDRMMEHVLLKSLSTYYEHFIYNF